MVEKKETCNDRKYGLEWNSKKTVKVIINGNKEFSQINIFINGDKFKPGDQFKYSGNSTTSLNTCLMGSQHLSLSIFFGRHCILSLFVIYGSIN